MKWSNYQTNLFNFIENGTGNAVVEAVAGSGKTTTIVEGLKRVKGSSLFLAFNKSIADELKSRGVNARTFHSLTYSPVTRHKGARNIDTRKLDKLVENYMKGEEAYIYGSFLKRLIGLGRQSGVGCLIPDAQQTWLNIMEHHNLELEHDEAELTRALELASDLLHWSNNSPMVDFDDLLYLAVKDGLALPKFDFVFVDEAQDTNAIQRAILRKILTPNSRIIAVGDPAQAIYGFRGADSESLNMIAEEFECERLPLTVSYRCPKLVVEHAQQWVKHIEAAPNAGDGVVKELHKWDTSIFEANDLIICRTTRPLISLAFKLIKNQVPARVMGREIGQGLKSLVRKMNANSIEELSLRIDGWRQREVEKAIVKRREDKAEAIEDKADALYCLINGLPEDRRTLEMLNDVIDMLFADTRNAVVLATIHKAKGLEAERVFWLNSSQCPAKWAKKDWQKQQEVNLCYVATTRAVRELNLIEE